MLDANPTLPEEPLVEGQRRNRQGGRDAEEHTANGREEELTEGKQMQGQSQ